MSHPYPDPVSLWETEVDLSKIPFIPISLYLPALVKAAAESTPFRFPALNATGNGPEHRFTLKAMTQGTTNHLFRATRLKSTGGTADVVIKIYGDGTNITIDRQKELAVHKLLSDSGLSSDLVLLFGNGHIYGFIEADVCSTHEVHDLRILTATAREMARWHATLPLAYLDHPSGALDVQPGIWATTQRWIEAIPESVLTWGLDKNDLRDAFRYLADRLLCGRGGDAPEPMVLGHGDLLCGNIIVYRAPTLVTIRRETYDEVEPRYKARFIDYEHATFVPRAFELANHFSEWAGFECDYTKLPSRGQRRHFISEYLQEYSFALKRDRFPEIPDGSDPLYCPHILDLDALDRVARDVDSWRGFPGFYWGVCALIQAGTATGAIDFDYKAYAIKRLGEYNAWKAFEEGSVPNPGSAPGREVHWNRN